MEEHLLSLAVADALFSVAGDAALRRERIATAVLQGLMTVHGYSSDPDAQANRAVKFADALIERLNR